MWYIVLSPGSSFGFRARWRARAEAGDVGEVLTRAFQRVPVQVMACGGAAAPGPARGGMTFTATLTSSLACLTAFLSIHHSTEGNENSAGLRGRLLFRSCLSRLSGWNTQIVLGNGFLFSGSRCCFSTSVHSVFLLKKQLMRVLMRCRGFSFPSFFSFFFFYDYDSLCLSLRYRRRALTYAGHIF